MLFRSDDDETPNDKAIVLGQRWIRNPTGHLLPRLDAEPLLLSFQPLSQDSSRPKPNGNPAVHPTRNNPHPHSREIPETEQTLLVVSAEHKIYQFEVLAGRLSEWSRRNPPSSYPAQFRRIDDPTKGCIWDVSEKRQRLWIYGEKWLFMFDLSKDFPVSTSAEQATMDEPATPASKKRKRDASSKGISQKSNSGAGDAIPETDVPVTKARRLVNTPAKSAEPSSRSAWIDFASARHAAESDDDDDVKHQALASLRRTAGGEDGAAAGGAEAGEAGGAGAEDKDKDKDNKKRGSESWWHSFKYRPILGIVPVGQAGEALEVVLVERPAWDLDLPPRFVGAHD